MMSKSEQTFSVCSWGVMFVVISFIVPLPSAGMPNSHSGTPRRFPALPPGDSKRNLEDFEYLSPVPGSILVSPATNVIIRPGEQLDAASVQSDLVRALGTKSGVHAGHTLLSDDQKTLVFVPIEHFSLGEKVTVFLDDGMRTASGKPVRSVSYSFTVCSREIPNFQSTAGVVQGEIDGMRREKQTVPHLSPPTLRVSGCDTLPPGYPVVSLDLADNPEPGVVFISPFSNFFGEGHLVILDNSGVPVFYRRLPRAVFDFKPEGNGTLTYFGGPDADRKFYAIDSSYAIVDSFDAGNGYATDLHDLVVLGDGHSLLMSYDAQIVNMDSLVEGGDTAATVIGLIIQELDASKNVIFQWRSWDYISILDGGVSGYVNLDSSYIDYIHGNAIDVDDDDNLLLSSRHLNEITKINRQTGNIIWRLGLNALHNNFTFVNDTRGFSHQHHVRHHPNGHITVFDNGNFLEPEYSRALEYELDEVNMIATLVWQYRGHPDIFGAFMGSVGRLESGGTMICWGGTFGTPVVTELHADGSKAMELSYGEVNYTYRAFRSTWATNMFTVDSDSLDFGTIAAGDSALRSLTVSNHSSGAVNITCYANSDSAFSVLSDPPIVIPPNSSIGLTLKFKPLGYREYLDRLYVRSVNDTQLVSQVVALSGRTDSITSVDRGQDIPDTYALGQNYPNPFNPSTRISFSMPRSGDVSLKIFNLLGEEVGTLVSGRMDAGTHTLQWDATGQPSGVYFYRLTAGDFVETRKLILIR